MANNFKIIGKLVLDNGDSLKSLEDLKKALIEARKVQQEMVAQFGEGSKEVQDITREIDSLQNTIDDLTASYEKNDKQKKKNTKTNETLEKSEKDANEEIKDTTKSLKAQDEQSKKSEKSGLSLTGMLKGLGIASLASSAVSALTEAFMSNQKVADTMKAIFGTLAEVINQLIGIFTSVYDKVSKSTGGFDALGKVMDGILRLVINPFKLAWFSISLAIDEVRLAWEESPFGNGDTATIEKLTKSISETSQKIKDTAVDSLEAGKQIATNFTEAVQEVGEFTSGVIDGVSKINVKNIYNNQKALVQLQNTAKVAAAELQGVVEEFDRKAEKERQIRDDTTKSIKERIDANTRLGKILEEQQKAQLALADQVVRAAKAELDANKSNVDLQVAYKQALNERKGVLAQITGIQSEQKMNEVALNNELIALNKAKEASDNELLFNQKKNNAEAITDEVKKIDELQAIRDIEREKELKRLQDNVNLFAEGTQARLDAEIEYNTKKQEFDQADEEAARQRSELVKQRAIDEKNAKIENALSEFELKRQLLEQEQINALKKAEIAMNIAKEEAAVKIEQLNAQRDNEIAAAEKAGTDTNAIKEKYKIKTLQINAQIAKSEKDLAKARIQANVQAADALSDTLSKTAQLFGSQTKAGKALSIASTTISTISSAQKAYESTIGIPFIGPYLAPVNAALALAAGVKNVKEIMKVQIPNVSGGNEGGGNLPTAATGQSPAATPPISPQAVTTALPQEQINQLVGANASVKAYVVESDVTNGQERITRLNRAARIS